MHISDQDSAILGADHNQTHEQLLRRYGRPNHTDVEENTSDKPEHNPNGAGMGEHLPSPTGKVPDYVLSRTVEVVHDPQTQVE